MDAYYKRIFSTIAESAARAANTFYECPTCSEITYTFIEDGKRSCFRCKFDNIDTPVRCTGCLFGCYSCTNFNTKHNVICVSYDHSE